MSKQRSFRTHADLPLSSQLATMFEVEQGHCFRNAWRCFILSPELFRPHGTLVEGWYVIETKDEIVLTEHGWIEYEGRIIDPSVILLTEPTTPVFYYPGVVRTWEETEALEGKMFPQVRFDGKYGADGLGHPGYKAARDAAVRKVYALAQAHQPPKAMHFWQSIEEGKPSQLSIAQTTLRVSGTPFLDLEQSCQVAEQIEAMPSRCWHNSCAAMLHLPRSFFFAHCIEGWMVEERADAILVIEHGWIETRHGSLVDPTLVLSEPPLGVDYFAGHRWSWPEVQIYTRALFPRARYTTRMDLAYQAACQHALEQAEMLAWQTGKPVLSCPGKITYLNLNRQLLIHTCWDFPVPTQPSPRIQHILQEIREAAER